VTRREQEVEKVGRGMCEPFDCQPVGQRHILNGMGEVKGKGKRKRKGRQGGK